MELPCVRCMGPSGIERAGGALGGAETARLTAGARRAAWIASIVTRDVQEEQEQRTLLLSR